MKEEKDYDNSILDVLEAGILTARQTGWAGDAEGCLRIIQEIHNLPSVIRRDTNAVYNLSVFMEEIVPRYTEGELKKTMLGISIERFKRVSFRYGRICRMVELARERALLSETGDAKGRVRPRGSQRKA